MLTFLLLSGILYMISFESFAGIRDDAPALVFPIKYNAGNFLQRKVGIIYYSVDKVDVTLEMEQRAE